LCSQKSEGVGALDRAPSPTLGHHLEHPSPGEERDVPVEAPGGHVVELRSELSGREGAISEESLEDAKANRMQQ
jgi:hypothetical protein